MAEHFGQPFEEGTIEEPRRHPIEQAHRNRYREIRSVVFKGFAHGLLVMRDCLLSVGAQLRCDLIGLTQHGRAFGFGRGTRGGGDAVSVVGEFLALLRQRGGFSCGFRTRCLGVGHQRVSCGTSRGDDSSHWTEQEVRKQPDEDEDVYRL